MHKAVVAMAFLIAGFPAHAANDDYYECTKADGVIEYSLFPCESGQEQRHMGGEEAPRREIEKSKRQTPPAAPRPEHRQGGESKINKEYHLASYKCVGKVGDILYTDAKDYLAFETYRCKQITLSVACAEAHDLKNRDPLAVVSIKLSCP